MICPICSNDIVPARTGRPPKYCSKNCTNTASRRNRALTSSFDQDIASAHGPITTRYADGTVKTRPALTLQEAKYWNSRVEAKQKLRNGKETDYGRLVRTGRSGTDDNDDIGEDADG